MKIFPLTTRHFNVSIPRDKFINQLTFFVDFGPSRNAWYNNINSKHDFKGKEIDGGSWVIKSKLIGWNFQYFIGYVNWHKDHVSLTMGMPYSNILVPIILSIFISIGLRDVFDEKEIIIYYFLNGVPLLLFLIQFVLFQISKSSALHNFKQVAAGA